MSRPFAVVGGCGRVGLPVGLALAEATGRRVLLYDRDSARRALVSRGEAPFREPGLTELLRRLGRDRVEPTADPARLTEADPLLLALPTEATETGLSLAAFTTFFAEVAPHLRPEQTVLVISTLPLGGTERVAHLAAQAGPRHVAYCPERIAEGTALAELRRWPQIVAPLDDHAATIARELLGRLGPPILTLPPREAEFGKLLLNAWRYASFAVANALAAAAMELGLDYERIRAVVREAYPRAEGIPAAGLAGGPCLPKDTQALRLGGADPLGLLAAVERAHADLATWLARRLADRWPPPTTVGLLGVAYKPGSDDLRGSPALALWRALEEGGWRVIAHDPYVDDPRLTPLSRVLAEAQVLVVATPHPEYRELVTDRPMLRLGRAWPTGSRR